MDDQIKRLIRKLNFPWHIGMYSKRDGRKGRRYWIPYDEYKVPGSFKVHKENYLKHAHTRKYARLLFEYRPDLYFKNQGLDLEIFKISLSKEEALLAAVVSKQIRD